MWLAGEGVESCDVGEVGKRQISQGLAGYHDELGFIDLQKEVPGGYKPGGSTY